MKSDKDSDIFSAETNDTAITKLNDGNNSDDGNSNSVLSKLCLLNDVSTAMTLHICSFLYHLLILSGVAPTVKKKKKMSKRKRIGNVHRERRSVIRFIHSWSEDMFRRQFQVTRDDFSSLETAILENMGRNGYNVSRHVAYATQSSGSPITVELRLYMTLRILSGASYLDMIWYAVDVRSVPGIFWQTVCDIDEAIENINFPTDEVGLMHLVDNWSAK
jgi:hypothetical protein